MLIMFTSDVKNAIQGELQFLKAQRDQIDSKIKALQTILSPDDQLGFFQP